MKRRVGQQDLKGDLDRPLVIVRGKGVIHWPEISVLSLHWCKFKNTPFSDHLGFICRFCFGNFLPLIYCIVCTAPVAHLYCLLCFLGYLICIFILIPQLRNRKNIYLLTGSSSDSSSEWVVIRESSSRISSSWSYYKQKYYILFILHRKSDTKSYKLYKGFTSNLSLVSLISIRELRHSPTTMPICLIRTTLLSKWLCMPPSMHWSKSEQKNRWNSQRFLFIHWLERDFFILTRL